jgi:hypothetical protein
MHAMRAALAGLVDYAGLFPPAGLDLRDTVDHHDRYAHAGERWMLGRLVVPVGRLRDLAAVLGERARRHSPGSWTVAALVQPNEIELAQSAVDRFHESSDVRVTAIEAVLATPDTIVGAQARWADALERFIEVPPGARSEAWLDAIAAAGCRAKLRAGGLTEDRFPTTSMMAALFYECARRNVPFKATAGLHHAIRGTYRITYEPGSPSGVMHGFVNLLLAALVLRAGGDAAAAMAALDVTDPRTVHVDSKAIRWERWAFGADACMDARAHLVRSVGSCSFEEPVSDLRALGWWPE